jgi:ankyrin repeat protein
MQKRNRTAVVLLSAAVALVAGVACLLALAQRSELVEAVRSGDYRSVVRALQGGANVNQVQRSVVGWRAGEPRLVAETALFIAARDGHSEIVRYLLAAGADPDVPCTEGGTALSIAASRQRRADIVRVLLEAGADPMGPRPKGRTALAWAALQGDYESVRLLLHASRRAGQPRAVEREIVKSLRVRNDDLRHRIRKLLTVEEPLTMVQRAARDGPLELLKTILSQGAEPSSADPGDAWTPLHWAAGYEGDVERTSLLLDAGANPNAATSDGYTPLMAAAQAGDAARVRLLLAAGANPNAVDVDNRSALHIAAWRSTGEVVTLLLRAGADVSIRNRWGQTARDVARARKRSLREDVTGAFEGNGKAPP